MLPRGWQPSRQGQTAPVYLPGYQGAMRQSAASQEHPNW
jgi:hypothetical protein